APSEVEQGILRPIEEAVRGVEGICEITSEAREARGEVLIELVKARRQWAEEFAGIEIVSGREGPAVTLGDIATIRDGFEEVGFHSQFNQTPADIARISVSTSVTATLMSLKRRHRPSLNASRLLKTPAM
ncbi:MAG: hypothetical protein ABGZ35_20250, partial [Planctomycetaceae bacterium]